MIRRTATVTPIDRHQYNDDGGGRCRQCGLGHHQGRGARAHAPVVVDADVLVVSSRMLGEHDHPRPQPEATAAPAHTPAPAASRSAVHLDWSGNGPGGAASVGRPEPCCHCHSPAVLRDPVSGQPCHKVCAEAELTRRATAYTNEKGDT